VSTHCGGANRVTNQGGNSFGKVTVVVAKGAAAARVRVFRGRKPAPLLSFVVELPPAAEAWAGSEFIVRGCR